MKKLLNLKLIKRCQLFYYLISADDLQEKLLLKVHKVYSISDLEHSNYLLKYKY